MIKIGSKVVPDYQYYAPTLTGEVIALSGGIVEVQWQCATHNRLDFWRQRCLPSFIKVIDETT